MHWNHRVVKEFEYTYEDEPQYSYTIREVFYNEDDEIIGWTAEGIDPYGESIEDLKETLTWMIEACTKPILEVDPEDENKLLNAVQGQAFDPEEPTVTYNSIEELLADLEAEDGIDSEGGNL